MTLTSASGLPSAFLSLTIDAVAFRSSGPSVTLAAHENQAITDDHGRAMFTLDIPSDAVTLQVKVWTRVFGLLSALHKLIRNWGTS